MAAFGCFILLTILSIFPITHHDDSAEATPGTVEVPTLAMVTGQENANLDIAPKASTGTFVSSQASDQASFTVQTSNYTGYTLSIEASDDTGQLTNSETSATLDSISSAVDASTFATGSVAIYSNKWGYQPSKFNSASNTDFLPAPTTTASVLDKTTSANPTANTYTIALGARVDYTKPVGTYTSTYTITAVANPVAYAINYYDGVNSTAIATQASSTNTAASITLNPTYTSGSAPTRSTYTFKSWCLGTVNSTTTYNTSTKTYNNQATVCTGAEYATGANMPIDPTVDNTDIKLYAVWTPTTFAQAYGSTAMTMQNMTSAICDKVTINQYATLTDNRDNQAYTIGKLEDGRCWMADNLNFDAYTNRNSITTSNTHIDANSSAILTSFRSGNRTAGDQYATGGINSSNSSGNNWTTSYSYSVPLQNRSGKCDPNINGSWQCLSPYQNANYTYNTVINKYGTPASDSSGTASTTYNIGPGSYKIGTYYNFCAASLGSYCWGNGTSAGTSAIGNATTADICPKGWRLPYGGASGTNSGEYQKLRDAIYAKYPSTVQSSTSPFSLQTMLSTPVSGLFNSATASRQGTYGFFWSSSYHSATPMYLLFVSGTGVSPQSNYSRYNGFSVRCIAQ